MADSREAALWAWYQEAGQAYGLPLPTAPEAILGPWGLFVTALHQYHSKAFAAAASDAELVASGPDVEGFAGLREQARILLRACHSALQNPTKPRRTYRGRLGAQLPPLPLAADFRDPVWQHYQMAVQAARGNDAKRAHILVYAGLKLAADAPRHAAAVGALKDLGRAITAARDAATKPPWPLEYSPGSLEEIKEILDHYACPSPPGSMTADVWSVVARLLVALDYEAWQVSLRRTEELAILPCSSPEERHLIDAIVRRAKDNIPGGVVTRFERTLAPPAWVRPAWARRQADLWKKPHK